MIDPASLIKIPISSLLALFRGGPPNVDVYLPGPDGNGAVLYSKPETGLQCEDVLGMQEVGVTHLYLQPAAFELCEHLLEARLSSIIGDPTISSRERAHIVQTTATAVSRELIGNPQSADKLMRAVNVVDGIVVGVLTDPGMAGYLVEMAAHERSTASHMFIVSALATMLGYEVFGPNAAALKALGTAGLLHDLGKLSLPGEVLNKAGTLTREDLLLIQQHPIESVRLLGGDPVAPQEVRQMILQHHERLDGRGYPIGLGGSEVLIESRILSIVDSFHALIGRRTYRERLTVEQANRVLEGQAGTQFDPRLLRMWREVCSRTIAPAEVDAFACRPSAESNQDHSVRYEHRPISSAPSFVDQRPPRYECVNGKSVACVHVGRLSKVSRREEFEALAQDVSRGGMCLLTEQPMYRGEIVNVELRLGTETVWVQSSVAWCRQRDMNAYKTGLKFLRRIPEEETRLPVPVQSLQESNEILPARPGSARKSQERASPKKNSTPGSNPRENQLRALETIAAMGNPDRAAEELAVSLSVSTDAVVRREALDVLMNMNTRLARDAIIASLDDSNSEIRERAASALGALAANEAVAPLRKLLRDPVLTVALRAAGALGRLGDNAGLQLVVETLEQPIPEARVAAQVAGEITGQRFGANREGIAAARRYIATKKLVSM